MGLVIECEFCHKFFNSFEIRKVFHHSFCLDCYRIQHSALIAYLKLRPNSKLKEFLDKYYFKTQGYQVKRKYLKVMKKQRILKNSIMSEFDLELHGD